MPYIDTFVKSQSVEALETLCASNPNHIGPIKGRAAFSVTEPDGTVDQVPACGDPDYWYAVIRTEDSGVALPDAIEAATKAECVAVCGFWA